jgi:cytochrome c
MSTKMFTTISRSTTCLALLLFVAFLFAAALPTQQPPQKAATAVIPVEAAKQANPIKSSPESLARAKKWWTIDCAMCHATNGNGKTDMATDMKFKLADFTDPASLKDRTDGELFYIIKNGYQQMPAEGPRIKPEENWDLVNYVRSLAKTKSEPEQKQ